MAATELLKRRARALIDASAGHVATFQIERVAKRRTDQPLLVLDIDNTLADSWPTFATDWSSERARLAAISPLPHIKSRVHDAAVDAGAIVVFLTHRNPWHWSTTRRWLNRNGFSASFATLVLVPSATNKVDHLRRLASTGPLDYWDDLSALHETGSMTLYEDVIAQVGAIDGVTYHGWSEVVGITGLGLDRPPNTIPDG